MRRFPTAYINHGGGPMPLLGQQDDVANFLRGYAATLPHKPSAVVVITAHWETTTPTVSAAARHELLFDYSGFPPETYQCGPAPAPRPLTAQRHLNDKTRFPVQTGTTLRGRRRSRPA